MTRLYLTQALTAGETVLLGKEPSDHLRVLRMRVGETLTVFNGTGGEFGAVFDGFEGKAARITLGPFRDTEREAGIRITLYQGLPEGSKMDFVIEKAVELGVFAIVPVACERSVVRLDEKRAATRLSRWESIIRSASEQCGRNTLCKISPPLAMKDAIGSAGGTRLLITPRDSVPLTECVRTPDGNELSLFVGPEGGFSPAEEQAAKQAGVVFASLGPRILRTETAALAAVSAIHAVTGGF